MGWSIVLYGGLYIDPFGKLGTKDKVEAHFGLSLEIVGLADVRLVLQTNQLLLCGLNLTMKNLSLYDRRYGAYEYVFGEINTANLKLVEVNIQLKSKGIFNICKNAQIEAINCYITKGLLLSDFMWACCCLGIRKGGKLRWLLDSISYRSRFTSI